MISRLQDLLEERGGNYILPFFWQHGEDEATLRLYIDKISESGIGAVCVEARPHPDFAGPQWWRDVDIILDACKQHGMQLWILDDSHFPTGFANGKMAEMPDELCKQYLACQTCTAIGPLPGLRRDLGQMAHVLRKPWDPAPARSFDTDRLLGAVAIRRDQPAEPLDLAPWIEDGLLRWDVPAGAWQIYVIFLTQNGGGNPAYINMLDEASVRVLIDAVYEPHWEHYKDEFGKTIQGFFFDEPAVGNTSGFAFDEEIGKPNMQLPWSRHMPALLAEKLGADWLTLAPALWTDCFDPARTGRIRRAFMDAVSELVSRCFGGQLGQWCRAHGVASIGHVVEDFGQHARLGPTLPHYFRALDGQDMAGIDDIGGQVIPGGEDAMRMRDGVPMPEGGPFYHFALGKMGASLAHIDPKKQGRAFCECFGAYGWGCGVETLWYLANHFLVRGINYFVPHAFSPKAYPDPDCPPHYYAHGHNAQFSRFGDLMRYLNRCCHLLAGGLHRATAAVLYDAEGRWAGKAMQMHKPIRALMEHQIDLEVVPADLFSDFSRYDAHFDGLTLTVNGVELRALVIPYTRYLPAAVARFIAEAEDFPVFFADGLPEGFSEELPSEEQAQLMAALRRCAAVPLGKLHLALRSLGLFDVQAAHDAPGLRCYLYEQEAPVLMLFNEGDDWDDSVWVAAEGPVAAYDAASNELRPVCWRAEAGGVRIQLSLTRYDATMLVFGADGLPTAQAEAPALLHALDLSSGWVRSHCAALEYPAFGGARRVEALTNVLDEMPTFSGYLCYETQVDLPATDQAVLTLQYAFEGPEVFVNGARVGRRLHAPYCFELGGLLVPGRNTIRIELATTPAAEVQAMAPDADAPWSGFQALRPSGLIGSVTLRYR